MPLISEAEAYVRVHARFYLSMWKVFRNDSFSHHVAGTESLFMVIGESDHYGGHLGLNIQSDC